jgi:glycosyltransferase involved in cell wall biosynthesis
MKKIDIVIPCYNESKCVELIYDALKELFSNELKAYSFSVLYIDDGSQDDTLERIVKLSNAENSNVRYISFARNFGKESAIYAGLENADGDYVALMDADLQHPPKLIPDMLKNWEEGFEDVYAKRITRGKESWLRKRLSILYYSMLQHMSRVEILENVGDFRLLDRKCIDALKKLRENQRYTKGMYCWIGFKKKELKFEQGDRFAGKSSFSFFKLLNLAIEGVTSYTTAPLRIATFVGLIVSLVAFVYMCYILFSTLIWGDPVQGYPTTITIILFLGGIQLLSLGIIGEYLGRIFYETKGRPVYIASEVEGL